MSADAFEVLGVGPLLGRGFLEGEDRPGSERVVVLSYGLWQSRFAGDPDVLGRALEIETTPHTIVGVMPPDFAFPLNTTRFWTPYQLDPARYDRDTRSFQVVARLAPGVSDREAQAELDLISEDLAREFPRFERERGANVDSLRSALNSADHVLRPMSALLGVAVGFLLLLTCANVASLLLARGVARSRELSIRVALGAARHRMLRLLLTESGVLAVLAGAIGLALAWTVLRGIDSAIPPDLYRVGRIALDPTRVIVTLGVCALATLLFGLAPALQASGVDPQTGLREGAAACGGARASHRVLGVLTAVQIGLAATLLLGSVLLTRSLAGLWEELTVVGIVGDSRHSSLQEAELQVYRPQYQDSSGYLRLLTRGAREPLARASAVKGAVAAIDPNLPATDLRTLRDVVDEFLLPQRGLSIVMALLALGALVLSAVGIYGVIGQFVSRRTREIGIRMAVGASRRSVLGMVLRRGLVLAGSGVLAGLAVAVGVARLLESFLFGVGALDPVSFLATGAFLLGVAALAAALPARRAARVDPLVALRWE